MAFQKKRNGKENFAVFKDINVVGWVFDGPERGGEFLGLLALNRRPLGYLN